MHEQNVNFNHRTFTLCAIVCLCHGSSVLHQGYFEPIIWAVNVKWFISLEPQEMTSWQQWLVDDITVVNECLSWAVTLKSASPFHAIYFNLNGHQCRRNLFGSRWCSYQGLNGPCYPSEPSSEHCVFRFLSTTRISRKCKNHNHFRLEIITGLVDIMQ